MGLRSYPKERNMDNNIFQVSRNGERKMVCFSDMTDSEKDVVLSGKQPIFLRQLCRDLAKTLYKLATVKDWEVRVHDSAKPKRIVDVKVFEGLEVISFECPNCSKPLDTSIKYCPRCGTKINWGA